MKGCFKFLVIATFFIMALLEVMMYGTFYILALAIAVTCLMIALG